MDKVESDCVLCVQEADIIALGHCNHKTFCFQCMIKMRVLSKTKSCPICKQDLDKIILTDNLNAIFQDFQFNKLKNINYSKDTKDVFYTDSDEVKRKVENLNNYNCPIQDCQADKQFATFQQLKLHLKDVHYKFFCDVCIEQKTCFITEQQLYTEYQLRHHQNQGDFDEDQNVIFKHPYCKYCKKHFYDEDKFKQHLNIAHINCNMCDDRKFTFYKDHGSYERHLKLSHYLCEEPECKQMLVVFKTSGELDLHKNQAHCNDPRIKKMTHINIQQFVGFYDEPKQKKQLNDREGEDFSDQFISLQKTNMRAIVQIDEHKDEIIDFREFLYVEYNDEFDKQCDYSEKMHAQNNLMLEDLHLVKPQTMPHMHFDSFLRKCSQFFKNKGKEEHLRKMIQMFESERFSAENFVNDFVRMFDMKTGLRLLTFYMSMRDVREQRAMWKILDDAYLKELKNLPRRNNSIIIICKTYSELFLKLLEELNKNLTNRIEEGTLVNYTDTIMPKERIFQLIEVLRHVKTSEMGKFKFALNFGLSTTSLEFIKHKILLEDYSRIQENILKISNHDLVPFYLYVNLSTKILKGEQIHKEKKDVNECVYYELFQKNKKLFSIIQKPAANGEVIQQQFQHKQQPVHSNGVEFDTADFPSLPKGQKSNIAALQQSFPIKIEPKKQKQQQQQQQQKGYKQPQGKWQTPGTLLIFDEQVIEDAFPTLGQASQQQQRPKTVQQSSKGGFIEDDSFIPISVLNPQKKDTIQDTNPILPEKKQEDLKKNGVIKRKGKTIIQFAGGFG